MRSNQIIGLDLPMKALAWSDENGQVSISYNDPGYLARRHGINDKNAVIKKMSGALGKLSDKAASKSK